MDILDKLNFEMQYSGSIDKPIPIYCPVYGRTETVYFNFTQCPKPPGFEFATCDNSGNDPECLSCRVRAEALFQRLYPDLPLLRSSD